MQYQLGLLALGNASQVSHKLNNAAGGTMLENNVLVLLGLGLSPVVLMVAAICFRWGPKREPLVWCGPASSKPLFIPSAEETAETVRRFRETAERAIMLDFIWDHYSRGRGLFIEEMRQAAKKRKKKVAISKWL